MENEYNKEISKKSYRSLLLIVDVQNGFISERTKHIPNLVEKLQYNYKYVIATRFINAENSFFRKLINWNRLNENSNDIEFAFNLKQDAIIIDKYIYTCVNSSFLKILDSYNIKEVDICGIDTDICVTKCAVDLFEHGIIPYVLKDYCATHAKEDINEVALKILARYIGEGQII
jgi:nicotinamidase-related amidase